MTHNQTSPSNNQTVTNQTVIDAAYLKATTRSFVVLRAGYPDRYYDRVVDPTTGETVDLCELLKLALTDVVEAREPQGNFLLKLELTVTVLDHAPLEGAKQTKDAAILPSAVTE